MWLFRLGAILDKARRVEDLQPSGHQSAPFGHSVLIMEIVCSRSATVQMLGQHRPDVPYSGKNINEFEKSVAQLAIRTLLDALSYRPDAT
jgi:hypothetical protein